MPANAALPLCCIVERPTVIPIPVVWKIFTLSWKSSTDPSGVNLAMSSVSAAFLILTPLEQISSEPVPVSLILLLLAS